MIDSNKNQSAWMRSWKRSTHAFNKPPLPRRASLWRRRRFRRRASSRSDRSTTSQPHSGQTTRPMAAAPGNATLRHAAMSAWQGCSSTMAPMCCISAMKCRGRSTICGAARGSRAIKRRATSRRRAIARTSAFERADATASCVSSIVSDRLAAGNPG